jgi:hypothetical protein
MPPINQQGSRAALITWIVVLAILFIGATIFAFYYSAEARNSTAQVDTFKKKYNDYVNESSFQDPRINDLKDLRSQEGTGFNKSMTVIDVALQQRDDLARTITGKPGTPPTAARDEARSALARAADEVKSVGVSVPSPSENLTGAVMTLAHAVAERNNELESTKKQLEESNKKVEATVAAMNEQLAAKDKDIEAAKAETTAAVESVSKREAEKQALIDEEQKGRTGDQTKSQEAFNKVQATVADRDRTIKTLQDQVKSLQNRLASTRVNPNGPVLSQSDGQIVRLPGNNICYINLGAGDQVSPGLTFEVYDKNEGVPALNDKGGEESLPEGKASIEVTRVGATSSECRIIHTKPGAHLTEGDLIANLVYDPNTKYTFLVYGNFDLDQNNVATAADAEVIKRLITQWGGKLSDKIGVDTDFVVLGKEPQVPNFTKEEQEDPVNQQKITAAKAELEAYDKVRAQAAELHIPVLNQNRFLYFVGYYDSSKR